MDVYKITGNFQQGGKWSKKGFEGHFVVNDGIVRGVMEELYEDQNPKRYIFGRLNNGRLAFFKVGDDFSLDPLFYAFDEFENDESDGIWGCALFGRLVIQGAARVRVNISSQDMYDDLVESYKKMDEKGCYYFNSQIIETWQMMDEMVIDRTGFSYYLNVAMNWMEAHK